MPKKILIVTHYFTPHVGGIEIVAYNQAKELVKKGYEVTIVTSKLSNEKAKIQENGIKIIRVKAWNFLERNFDVPYPIFSPKLISILEKEIRKADLIHVHGLLYMGSFVSAYFTNKYNKPFIVTEHVGFIKYKSSILNLIERTAFKTIGKYTANKSKRILVLNKSIYSFISNLTKTKIEYLENGVDTNLFKPVGQAEKILLRRKYNLPLNRKLVLFVGRFVEKKGVDLLVKAKQPGFDMVLIGEGRLLKKINKTKGIFIFNFLSQGKLKEIYQASDVFILPSLGEGFPLSLLEAMSTGLPVITTKQNNYKQSFNTKYIKLIDQTLAQIKSSLKEILGNKTKMEKMKIYSRSFAVNNYTWQKHTEELIKIYKTIKI